MSLFSVLGVGTRGLAASQLAMDVAGQNISNADVDGYSRKRLNMAPDYRYDAEFGQMGFGVEVVNIERQRDAYIDQQIQRQNQEMGTYKEIDYALERVENIFTEPTDSGLLSFMDKFFDSWQNLVNNPADLSARTMVKTNAEILTNVFQNLAGELNDLRQGFNTELQTRVDRVNELSKEIFNLNQEIAAVEVSNQHANDSRDKRDKLVKELSTLVDTTVTENERGQISVATSGTLIVSPVFYQELETTTASFPQPDGTTRTDIGVRFKNSKRIYNPLGGQVLGLFQARDAVVPEFQAKLDTLATDFVAKVNDLHMQGFNLLGYSGMPFFDPAVTGASDISLSAEVLSNVQNIAAAGGGANQPVTTAFAAGALDFGNPAANLPNRNIVHGTVVVNVGGAALVEDVDYHIDYALGTIQMLHAGYNGQPATVDYEFSSGAFAGPGDNQTALAIAQLRDTLTMDPNTVGNYTSTFGEYYSSFIGRLGLNRNEAKSNLETRQYLIEQYNTQQDAIAGVSLDEEMASLVKYQHTYTAAARLITTASDMLDVLMKM